MVRALWLAIRRAFAAQQVASKHVDHLNRPVKMTDTEKAAVWDAIFLALSRCRLRRRVGGVHAITGSAALDARFPGQWFQLESGLHYNWHRQYDPSIGRYTQPDPLGFVDGPSVYGYVRGRQHYTIDPTGTFGWGGAASSGAVSGVGQIGLFKKYGNNGAGMSFSEAVRCVNITNVAISAYMGYVGPTLRDVFKGRSSLAAYGANVAIGTVFKKTVQYRSRRTNYDIWSKVVRMRAPILGRAACRYPAVSGGQSVATRFLSSDNANSGSGFDTHGWS